MPTYEESRKRLHFDHHLEEQWKAFEDLKGLEIE